MKAVRKALAHLRRIERGAYPPEYRQIQEITSWRGLAEYCEGRPHLLTWSTGYCLWTEEELVDLAAVAPVTYRQLLRVVEALRKTFGDRSFRLDAREGTSWRLLVAMERRGLIEVLSADPYEWAGETFYEVVARFRQGSQG